MARPDSRSASSAGYTLVELLVVLGIIALVGSIAWPLMAGMLQEADLVAATQILTADMRWARHMARAQGRTLFLRFDPPRGYAIGEESGPPRRSVTLPGNVGIGSPADPESDGVTFRDNTAVFTPRGGLSNSFGAVTLQTRSGAARKITINIAGYTSLAVWTGSEWR